MSLATTSVESIEVTPSALVVAKPLTGTPPPVSFQLEARLWDQYDRIIPENVGKEVSWQAYEGDALTDLVTLDPDGHSVVVEIPVFPVGGKNITLKAEVEGISSDPSATITLVEELPTTGNDIILSSHPPGATANVAMVDGEETGTICQNDGTYVFINAAILPDLVSGCSGPKGEVAVFSPDRQLYYNAQQDFAIGLQTVNSGSPSPEFDTLPVKLWSAVHQEGISEVELQNLKTQAYIDAILDLELASYILEANRVGIVLETVLGYPETIDGNTNTNSCPSNQAEVVHGVLNLYIVAAAMGYGVTCIPDPGQEAVIFLMQKRVSPTLMAHEIGHALALWKPGRHGHTDGLKGFGTNNVMLGFEADYHAENRHHFSLGQAFRMNVDEDSWLNHSAAMDGAGNVVTGSLARAAGLTRLQCQCATHIATPCPKLSKDFLSPDTDLPPGEPWRCVDIIYLGQSQGDDDAVGLMRGRRRESTPGTCEWVAGLPARYSDYALGRLLLEFPNLTKSGCASEDFAVFFSDHATWYRPVPDDPGLSRMYWDFIPLTTANDVPGEPWKIPVVLWFEDDDAPYDATDDKAVADTVYGGVLADGTTNRTGITLTWEEQQSADWVSLKSELRAALDPILAGSCSVKDLETGKINVYFLNTNQDFEAGGDFYFMRPDRGAACMDPGNDIYIIALAVPPNLPRSTTGLAHYIGHMFALPEVPETDHTIMRHDPLVGGPDRSLILTLGQVFHLNVSQNSWLNTSSASERKGQTTESCLVGTPTCPNVDMHVVP